MSATPLYRVQSKCPFCGDDGQLFQKQAAPGEAFEYFVGCQNKGCETDGPLRPNKLDAIKAWTERHGDA